MVDPISTPAGAALADTRFDTLPYIEWSPILAGTLVAMAVSFVLLTFGSAVGLSAVSPWTSTRGSVAAVSMGAAFWLILVNIWAFALGGYLAGRMRHRHSDASEAEVHFRDGTHGAVMWATAVTVGAVIAAMVATSLAKGALEGAASAARASGSDPVSIAADTLLRTNATAPNARSEDVRTDVSNLLARSVGRGEIAPADRTYLANVVAARSAIPAAEAEKRVDATIAQMKNAADRARKAAVVLAFITAATLLLGVLAAWWGAITGGQHRDQRTVWPGLAANIGTDPFRKGVKI